MSGSPSVNITEIDLSLNTRALGETAGGFVGSFGWGPINTPVSLADADDLELYFGKPSNQNYVDWFSVDNFLKYTGNVVVMRVADSAVATNATSESAGVLIKNATDFEVRRPTLTENFIAKYAGELGNSISVSVADSTTFATWKYKNEFDSAPASSENAEIFVANANDEIHVVVVDRIGKFTGVQGAILERFPFLSKATDALDVANMPSYYATVINQSSQYVWVGAPLSGSDLIDPSTTMSMPGAKLEDGKPFAALTAVYEVNLTNGNSGGLAPKTEYVNGYEEICAYDDDQVSVIFSGNCGGDANHADVANAIGVGCKGSSKRVGFISPKITDVVNVASDSIADTNIEATWSAINEKHSYLKMATGVKMIYDKYNQVYRWIPTNSDEAGVWAATHNTVGKWMSGAGYNRGIYKNVVKLAYNPKKPSRDKLYKLNINPVVQEKGYGVLLLGDKTLQSKNTAFSFGGTRFLFIELKNIIGEAGKFSLFEFNDDFTRAQFVDLVTPVLRDIKGQRGLHDFLVVCDETNNTDKVIQDGQFIGDILIKPQYSIQWVNLRFTAVGRTLKFEEIVQNNQ